MKRILGILVMLFLLYSYAGAVGMDVNEKKPVNVELNKNNPSEDDTHPRTLIPITCVYVDGVIQLSLLDEIGEFTLSVTNQTTGELWSVVNSLSLNVSTASGIYLVQILTEDGSIYYGTYTL